MSSSFAGDDGADTCVTDARIGAALLDYEQRGDAGVNVWHFLADHIDVAADLIRYFRTVEQLAAEVVPADATPADAPFEHRGSLGEGSFGVVHLMWQPALGRHVAVKTLKTHALGGSARLTRFEREAMAVGGLNHANIVAVYERGHDPHGRPYLVMEYVEGETLRALLARGVLGFAAAAALVACLARAAHEAHAKGIVHRDIKPANVLLKPAADTHPGAVRLGPRDDAVVVPKLADFGLAWRGEPDTADGAAETTDDPRASLTKGTVGTLHYMSPEQADGRDADPTAAADVYALGVILYECLTGHVPFTGDWDEARAKILREEPVPPRRDRRNTPRDLETICLKCLMKNPADRYASAADLAADLDRYRDNKPIRARRTGRAARAWKWAARHPARAALTAVGVLVPVAAVVALVGWNVAIGRERDRTVEQRDRATASLKVARGAVNDYSARLNQDPRLRFRDLEDLRRELLASAVGYYASITELAGDDPDVRHERAKAFGRLAEITADIGTKTDALAQFERARSDLEALVRDVPDNPDYRRSLATTANLQANALRRTDQPHRAEEAYRRAIDLARGLTADAADRRALAGACGNMANYLSRAGRPGDAAEFYREATAAQQKLVADHPGDPGYARDLAATHRNAALALLETGRVKEAEDRMARARDLGEGLVKARPKDEESNVSLGATLNNLANLYAVTGRPAEAERAHLRAVQLADDLSAAHPRLLQYRLDLSQAVNNLGALLAETGRYEDAEKAFVRARDIRRALVAADPGDTTFRRELAAVCGNLGFLYQQFGKDALAAEAYAEEKKFRDASSRPDSPVPGRPESDGERAATAAALRGLVKAHPEYPGYARDLSRALVEQGGTAAARRDWPAALRHYDEALALRRKLADAGPAVVENRRLVATVLNDRGRVYHLQGDFAAAATEYRQAVDINAALVKAHPTAVDHRRSLVLTLTNLGTALGEANDLAAAETALRDAEKAAADLARDFAPLPRDRRQAAAIQNGLGVVYVNTRRREQADAAYRKAIEIGEALCREFPANVEYAAARGLAYGNMGEFVRSRVRPEVALDWFDRSLGVLVPLHDAHPKDETVRKYRALSHRKRAAFLQSLQRHADALPDCEAAERVAPPELALQARFELIWCVVGLRDYRRAAELVGRTAQQPKLVGAALHELAEALVLCAAAAAEDEKLPAAERQRLVPEYAAAAVALLRRAHDAGFFRDEATVETKLRNHPAFAPLAGRPDFKRLLGEVEASLPAPPGR